MKKIFELLKRDKELQQLRQSWEEKFTEAFPPWNYDCFSLDNYKPRIKMALEAGDSKIICETCPSQACKRFPPSIKKCSDKSNKET